MYRGLLPGSELVQLDKVQHTHTHDADIEDALVRIADVLAPASGCCYICNPCAS